MARHTTPPPLKRGDKVAIVAPSGGAAARYPHVRDLGLRRLRDVYGLEPVLYPTAKREDPWLHAHPDARARDVNAAFRDPDVRAVMATVGGNDQVRILRHLDAHALREDPKRFYGISDNTNLHLALWNQGVVSYYGGQLMSHLAMDGAMHDHTAEHLRRALLQERVGEVAPAARFTDQSLDWGDPENLARHREMEPSPGWTWARWDGAVEGVTWGGCLEIVALHLAAHAHLPPMDALDGAVILLETSEEMPEHHVVRRVLMAMGERGILQRAGAVVVGRAKARSLDHERPPRERAAYRRRQREAFLDVVGDYAPDTPLLLDFDVGHTDPVVTVPLGATARLDPDAGTVAFH